MAVAVDRLSSSPAQVFFSFASGGDGAINKQRQTRKGIYSCLRLSRLTGVGLVVCCRLITNQISLPRCSEEKNYGDVRGEHSLRNQKRLIHFRWTLHRWKQLRDGYLSISKFNSMPNPEGVAKKSLKRAACYLGYHAGAQRQINSSGL